MLAIPSICSTALRSAHSVKISLSRPSFRTNVLPLSSLRGRGDHSCTGSIGYSLHFRLTFAWRVCAQPRSALQQTPALVHGASTQFGSVGNPVQVGIVGTPVHLEDIHGSAVGALPT